MRFKIFLIVLLVTLIWFDRLHAQGNQLHFERISLEEGLSQSVVYCILQDSRGFMWFGTEDGLNKYDGFSFEVYKHDPQNPNSLSNNEVWSIYEDRLGIMWIGTWGGGLNKFDRNRETFTHYVYDPDNPGSLNNNDVRTIYEDQSGILWIGTWGGGLNRYDRKTETFSHYKNEPDNSNGLTDNHVQTIYEDKLGVMWIGTEGGLNQLDRKNGIFRHYRNDPADAASLSDDRIRSICEDRFGVLWIGTEGGLDRFDRKKGIFAHFKNKPAIPPGLSSDQIRSIYEDQSGVIWIGTWGGGLNRFDREKGEFLYYKNNPDDPHSLSSNEIRSILEDRSGILWIGTNGGGVNKLDRKRERFKHYRNDINNPNSLSNNIVWSIYEDNSGILWIGTWDGLNRFDREKQEFTHYLNKPNYPNSLSHDLVWCIYESLDEPGVLWIGTQGGLDKLITSSGTKGVPRGSEYSPTFIHYRHEDGDSHSLSDNRVRAIYQDRSGVLWIGTRNGLNRFNKESENFTCYVTDPDDPSSLSNNHIVCIFEDQSKDLWIGTREGGLNKFDRNKEIFTHYMNDPNDLNSLSNNRVLSIYEDRAGMLWVGTPLGFNKFNRKTGKFTHFTERNGLPNDKIYGILEDDHGNLWLSTNNGLSVFNPQDNSFRNYDIRDGLQSNEFNVGAYHRSRSGEMFFGGINGFNAFYPDSIQDNPHIPPIVITTFKKFGQTIKEDIHNLVEEIELTYKDKYLTFEFVALDYTNPEKNQYAFIMEGFDEDWIYSGSRRFANYTNLDAGEYVFRVKGSNNDGVWNDKGASVKITIAPPPWKTWWAYLLYTLFVISVLVGIRRYELNRIRLKNDLSMQHLEAEKFKELDHLKSRFFANISHEFRTPLTLILGPIENVAAKISDISIRNQLGVAFQNSRRLLGLINQLLDLSKLEAGGMELKASRGNIIDFLKGVVFTFESIAQQKQITIKFQSDQDYVEAYFDREKLEQVFYNLMSNAVKFTPEGGRIEVVIKYIPAIPPSKEGTGLASPFEEGLRGISKNASYAEITIHDTGIGIPIDQMPKIFDRFYRVDNSQAHEYEGTGIGLALAKEIVELHYGRIAVKSEQGKGTEFIVLLPLGKEHLKENEVVDEPESEIIPHENEEFVSTSIDEVDILSKEDHASSKEIQDSHGEPAEDLKTEIVLIVEDNADVRTYIQQQLEPDYHVIKAIDGQDGIEKAIARIPNLIVSDIMMPNIDGYQFCKTLKNNEKTSHIPIILLTAKAGNESKLEGLENGADDYLTKPFNSKELRMRIKNLIEQRRKLREKFSGEVVLKPGEIPITSMEEQFLNRIKAAVEENLGNEAFSVTALCQEVGMSRVQLHRKLHALTNFSAGQFILLLRLQRAAELLKQNAGTVSEIAYTVGFNTPNYFAKSFRKQFGCSPSEYKTKFLMD